MAIKIIERDPSVLASIMNQHRGQAGVVFCATVRTADKLHAEMRSQGRAVTLYHGRLKPKEKIASQRAFMSGECPVAVVTDAFLLGIDKADVRFTVHYDYPKSIDDWVQGFGRAGRDGLPSGVFGCFEGSTQGKDTRRFLIGATYPLVDELERVWEYLIAAPFRAETQSEIGEKALGGGGKYKGPAALAALQRHNLAAADKHPKDGRKRVYRGCGDFASTDWSRYVRERADAFARFDQLCDLVALPDAEIPAAIDEYFEQ